jgi:hypothetical protein
VLSTFDGREWQRAALAHFRRRRCRPGQPAGARPGRALRGHAGAQQPALALGAGRRTPAQPPCWHVDAAHDSDLQWLTEPAGDRADCATAPKATPTFRHGPALAPRRCRIIELPCPGFNPRTCLAQRLRRDPRWAEAEPASWCAVLERLRTGGYSYTLEPGVYGQHTADEFWFDRKRAFASTLRRLSSS